jgi:hypothetical protein
MWEPYKRNVIKRNLFPLNPLDAKKMARRAKKMKRL